MANKTKATGKTGATKTAANKDGRGPRPTVRARTGLRNPWARAVLGLVVLVVLAGLYWLFQSSNDDAVAGTTPRSDYQIGSPGPGEPAPDFALPSTSGERISLSDYKGKTVLLYFHEGGGCQPCWDQIRDLEGARADIRAAGIDELVTITTDPVDLIDRKMRDDGLSSVALADTDLAVSEQYQTNKYGMMGDTRNGHSFLLVEPDGTIGWRADYGGAPKYTMYVPVTRLLADIEAGARG